MDVKMTYHLDACKLDDDKVFHIHAELHHENTDIFIKKSPNPSAWEISNPGKQSTMRQLDICFDILDAFIESMRYCYDKMADLHWVNTNKLKFKKTEGGKQKAVSRSQMMDSEIVNSYLRYMLVFIFIISKILRIW